MITPPRLQAFRVGPLAVDAINRGLALELEPADVWVSKACHEHIWYDHPDDYELFINHIVEIVRSPMWVGQDPKQSDNFYIVQSIAVDGGRRYALVAVGLELNKHGTYSVKSAYAIKQKDMDKRLARGSLKRLLPR